MPLGRQDRGGGGVHDDQVDDADELAELRARAQSADMALLDEGATTCCYARSDKHWVIDPQGLPWEHFQTLGSIPVFREAEPTVAPVAASAQPMAMPDAAAASACCTPRVTGKPIGIPVKSVGSSCC